MFTVSRQLINSESLKLEQYIAPDLLSRWQLGIAASSLLIGKYCITGQNLSQERATRSNRASYRLLHLVKSWDYVAATNVDSML